MRIGRILLLFSLLLSNVLAAQEGFVYIDQISIEGNRRTRSDVVFRELRFHRGDSIPLSQLSLTLEESEQLIMNTGLFQRADITFKNWEGSSNKVHIHIAVEETWYIYPVPILELVDRNFNVWWVEQQRSLDRINFGIEFTHLNFTGHRDKFKLTAKYGYTRSYSMKYNLPFINKAKTIGINTEIDFARNRETNYATVGNKQEFFKDPDRFLYQRFNTVFGLSYRPGHHLFHRLRFAYRQYVIDNLIANELNPNFFGDGRNLTRFFALEYSFTYDRRDVRAYPLKGTYMEVKLNKDGVGIFNDRNSMTLWADFARYFSPTERFSFSVSPKFKLSLIRDKQPYIDYRAIGFGRNNLHGFEYYIVDGLDMALLKTVVRYRLLNTELNFGKWVPIKAFRRMPIRMYFTLNNDVGIANDPYFGDVNPLNRQLLWGGGPGLDFVFYYDKVLRVEFSMNHLGEKGLFLHFNTNIQCDWSEIVDTFSDRKLDVHYFCINPLAPIGMQVVVFSKLAKDKDLPHIQTLFDALHEQEISTYVYGPYLEQLDGKIKFQRDVGVFEGYLDLSVKKFDFFITMGGDGTILEALTHVRDSGVPIVGINLGRLGFLASIEKKRIREAITLLVRGMYRIEERKMLYLESNLSIFGDIPFGLNDCTLLKRDTSSMITIHTFINGGYLNSYWADGIIIATPTGSTGYSLSCGGPIIFPNSGNFVITPVAPHNLNVRPIVISDDSVISFEVEGRTENFLCTLDSRFETISSAYQLAVRKNDFPVRLVELQDVGFLETLRNKLAWGTDSRNQFRGESGGVQRGAPGDCANA